MAFAGFPVGGVDFFRALTLNQDRDWFKAHKTDYERLWQAPMTSLIAEVHAKARRLFPESANTTPKVFRIYRDVRFSKDKTPFKTQASAVLPLFTGGATPEQGTGFYCEFGVEGSFIAAGRWVMEPEVLLRYRKAVADDKTGAALATEVKRLAKAGFALTSMDQLKRVPPGYDKNHPRAELLRHKGCAFTFPQVPQRQWADGPALVATLLAGLKNLAPVVRWVEAVATGKRPPASLRSMGGANGRVS